MLRRILLGAGVVFVATLCVAMIPQAIGRGAIGGGAIEHGAIGGGAIGGKPSGGSVELPSGAWVAFLADDLNGNADGNTGWTNGDGIDTATPWVSSGSFAAELEDGTVAQTLVTSCDGHPCVRGTSSSWSEVKDGTPADWSPLGADGLEFSCHIYLRTTSASPAALLGVWGTATTSSASRGSLFYLDDRPSASDKILAYHYPGTGGDLINGPNGALPPQTWTVLSYDYPGEASGGNVHLYKDGVSIASQAVSATYNNGTSSDFLNLGSVAAFSPFAGDFRAFVCYTGSGSIGLAPAVTAALQARFP